MKNADSPVYPFTYSSRNEDGDITEVTFPGVSKREHFAGLAMQGLLTIYDQSIDAVPNESNIEYMATLAVKAADKLLKALEE